MNKTRASIEMPYDVAIAAVPGAFTQGTFGRRDGREHP
jgi:hypothetical protein